MNISSQDDKKMSEYFGQHRENDWKLWNLPQFLSIPPENVGIWGIPFAKRGGAHAAPPLPHGARKAGFYSDGWLHSGVWLFRLISAFTIRLTPTFYGER